MAFLVSGNSNFAHPVMSAYGSFKTIFRNVREGIRQTAQQPIRMREVFLPYNNW